MAAIDHEQRRLHRRVAERHQHQIGTGLAQLRRRSLVIGDHRDATLEAQVPQ